MMYEQGYQDARAGLPTHVEDQSDREYVAGYDCGKADREESEENEINDVAQDFVDGYQRAEAGDEFDIVLLESEAYRAGFRDGERMNGVHAPC